MRAPLVGGAALCEFTLYYCSMWKSQTWLDYWARPLEISGVYGDACQCSHGKNEYCNPSFGTNQLKRLRCIPIVASGIRRFGDMIQGGIYCDDFDRRCLY